MAGRWTAVVVALRAVWSEHLVDEAFGSDVLDLGKNGRLFLLRMEAFTNSVINKSHQTGGDNYAGVFVSIMFKVVFGGELDLL